MNGSQKLPRRTRLGNALIRFSGSVLLISALVKLSHSPRPVAYMNFLGYEDEKMYLIAVLEALVALLFLRHTTRSAGLLLVSSYLGGAIAAHLASHPLNGNTPIVIFMFHHSYLGTLPAIVVLGCAWIGVMLRHPETSVNFTADALPQSQTGLPRQQRRRLSLLGLSRPTRKKDGLEVGRSRLDWNLYPLATRMHRAAEGPEDKHRIAVPTKRSYWRDGDQIYQPEIRAKK